MLIIYIAMIIFSSAVGQWVQRAPSRLKTLLTTIAVNRGSVIIGSFVWLLILSQEDLVGGGNEASSFFVSLPINHPLKHILFAVAMLLGIIERLSASGNMISMERDWVVTVAAPAGSPYDLTHLNAVMRRMDLVCKLVSPIVISVVISSTGSTRWGVVFTGCTSLISLPIEALSARRVWETSLLLKAPKVTTTGRSEQQSSARLSWTAWFRRSLGGFQEYFSESVWVPSVALAMLHFNMMTWRATFIAYLINVNYSLNVITVARAVGSVFEVMSTVVTPWGIKHMGRAYHHRVSSEGGESSVGLLVEDEGEGEDEQTRTIIGLQRFGLWGFSWQLVTTVSDIGCSCSTGTS
jgi:solute carrier family 40 (iron-regulated transporter), member 1